MNAPELLPGMQPGEHAVLPLAHPLYPELLDGGHVVRDQEDVRHEQRYREDAKEARAACDTYQATVERTKRNDNSQNHDDNLLRVNVKVGTDHRRSRV